MRLLSLQLQNNVIFGNQEFDFSSPKSINTVSGKNGSGKTSLFTIIEIMQKAYFVNILKNSKVAKYNADELDKIILSDCQRYIVRPGKEKSEERSMATLKIRFDEKDVKLLSERRRLRAEKMISESLRSIGVEEDGQTVLSLDSDCLSEKPWVDVTLTFSVPGSNETRWSVTCDDTQKRFLDLFWNLEDPKDLFLYLSAERRVRERDITLDEMHLTQDTSISKIVDVILNPDSIYDEMYGIMIDAWLLQRIDPRTHGRNWDEFIRDAKVQFHTLIPSLEVTNFSPKKIAGQVVLTAAKIRESKDAVKRRRTIPDIRDFSSGEKLIWYTLLLIYYVKNIGILIIDEPENHLHEDLAWRFVDYLNEVCVNGSKGDKPTASRANINSSKSMVTLSQVFLITHSKNIIYHNFNVGENYLLQKGQLSELMSSEAEESLRQLGISSVYEHILMVEGKTDAELWRKTLKEYNVNVVSMGGCKEVIKAYHVLSNLPAEIAAGQIVFLIDRDTHDDAQIRSIEEMNKEYFDKHFYILNRRELENYFIEPEQISRYMYKLANDLHKPELATWSDSAVRNMAYEYAGENLEKTKQECFYSLVGKCLNNQIEGLITPISKASADDDSRLAKNISCGLSQIDVNRVIEECRERVNVRYSSEEWEKNWIALCNGKNVFNRITARVSRQLGIDPPYIKNGIMQEVLNNNNSDIVAVKNNILILLGIE